MILLISPAKKLDLSEETRYTQHHSQPDFQQETQELVGALAEMNQTQIGELMHLSANLSELNFQRYQDFNFPFTPENAKQALLCFNGDVYQSFELDQYGAEEFTYAQAHLRILSGLYGLLRPLDLIQPYRLEMGTRMANARGRNLYAFWGDRITQAVNSLLQASDGILINLASNEYFKSVQLKQLEGRVITPVFKDARNGGYKTLFLYAKQARGAMCDFAIKEKITDAEGLKDFGGMGYAYNAALSEGDTWVFTR